MSYSNIPILSSHFISEVDKLYRFSSLDIHGFCESRHLGLYIDIVREVVGELINRGISIHTSIVASLD